MEIMATQTSPKDDIVYVAFSSVTDVRNIYGRAAICKHPDVTTQNFVPPQFFEKYMYLSKKCAEARKASGNTLKTQIRFNHDDIEVLTKIKNSNESYKIINLEEICDMDELPNFDPNIKWRKKFSKTQRDRLDESPARGKPPSMSTGIHSMSRSSSLNEAPRKKPRTASNDMDISDLEGNLQNSCKTDGNVNSQ